MPSSSSDSSSLRPRRRPPEWVPGLFYPLVVAALLGLVAVLVALREDVAVIKVRLEAVERAAGVAQGRDGRRERIPANTFTQGEP